MANRIRQDVVVRISVEDRGATAALNKLNRARLQSSNLAKAESDALINRSKRMANASGDLRTYNALQNQAVALDARATAGMKDLNEQMRRGAIDQATYQNEMRNWTKAQANARVAARGFSSDILRLNDVGKQSSQIWQRNTKALDQQAKAQQRLQQTIGKNFYQNHVVKPVAALSDAAKSIGHVNQQLIKSNAPAQNLIAQQRKSVEMMERLNHQQARLDQTFQKGRRNAAQYQQQTEKLTRAKTNLSNQIQKLNGQLIQTGYGMKKSGQGAQFATKSQSNWTTAIRTAIKWAIAYQVAYAGLNAVVQGVGASITLASGATEAFTKNIELFGAQAARKIEETSKKTARLAGMNTTLYQETIGTMGAFLQAAGHTAERSLKISTDMVQRIADVASFYNQAIEEVTAKFQTVLAGTSPRPGYALGIDTTIKTMQEFMQEFDRFRGRFWADLQLWEKQELRYLKIMQDTAKAAGDFVRTSDNFANTARISLANIQNAGKSIGDFLIKILRPTLANFNEMFTGDFEEGYDRFLQRTEQAARRIGEVARLPKSEFVVQFAAFMETLENFDVEAGGVQAISEFISRIANEETRIDAAAAALAKMNDTILGMSKGDWWSLGVNDSINNTIHNLSFGVFGKSYDDIVDEDRQRIYQTMEAYRALGREVGFVEEAYGTAAGALENLLASQGIKWEQAEPYIRVWAEETDKILKNRLALEQLAEETRKKIGYNEHLEMTEKQLANQIAEERNEWFALNWAILNANEAARVWLNMGNERAHEQLRGVALAAGTTRERLLALSDQYDINIIVDGQVKQGAIDALMVLAQSRGDITADPLAALAATGGDIENMNVRGLMASGNLKAPGLLSDLFNVRTKPELPTAGGGGSTTTPEEEDLNPIELFDLSHWNMRGLSSAQARLQSMVSSGSYLPNEQSLAQQMLEHLGNVEENLRETLYSEEEGKEVMEAALGEANSLMEFLIGNLERREEKAAEQRQEQIDLQRKANEQFAKAYVDVLGPIFANMDEANAAVNLYTGVSGKFAEGKWVDVDEETAAKIRAIQAGTTHTSEGADAQAAIEAILEHDRLKDKYEQDKLAFAIGQAYGSDRVKEPTDPGEFTWHKDWKWLYDRGKETLAQQAAQAAANASTGGDSTSTSTDTTTRTFDPTTGTFTDTTPTTVNQVLTVEGAEIVMHADLYLEDGQSFRAWGTGLITEVIGR